MTKKEVQKRVLQNGKPLSLDKFTWDEETKTFSSNEGGLFLDFSGEDNCTFETEYNCTFKTGTGCTFKTGSDCTFNTGHRCIFNTGHRCIFNTESGCTFKTGSDCTFDTGSECTFDTGARCVVTRRDIYEVIELEEGIKIKLNESQIRGYKVIEDTHKIVIDGKEEVVEIGVIIVTTQVRGLS